MKNMMKSQPSLIVEAGIEPEQVAKGEIYFGLGVLAAKHLSAEFGQAAPLVEHLIDQEFAKSELRANLDSAQLEFDNLSQKFFAVQLEKESLVKISNNDPLTGLVNRRGAEAAYLRFINHAKRDNDRRIKTGYKPTESQILVIDIDDFKKTNDTHGHNVGDELLIKVAEIMTKSVRQSHVIPDMVSRLGGDEFLILMYGAPRKIADDTANAIRDEVKDLVLANPQLKSSVSIGVGMVDLDLNFRETVDLADRALLQAKKNGKNVVVHFDDMFELN